MFTTVSGKSGKVTVGSRNWETNIEYVSVKACDKSEDPLGFKAVFHLEKNDESQLQAHTFEVGASFLAQRELNLKNAGFKAPMTGKAITLIEEQLGTKLRFGQKSFA